MRLTLLDYVQLILSSLDSDEVNSISDTPESIQVANIVKTTYFDLIARGNLPEHTQMLQLEASSDSTRPVMTFLPDGVDKIHWLKYFNSNIISTPPGTTPHGLNVDILPQPSWTTTSTTSNTIGTGTKTFTTSSSNVAVSGQGVTITVNPSGGSMSGTVISYSGTTLVVSISVTTGSGTFSNWNIGSNASFNVAAPGYQDVFIIPFHEFINIVTNFNPTDGNVKSFTFEDASNNFPTGPFTFYYKNDRQPTYATVLSDYYMFFDAFDSTQDSTIQTNKCLAYGDIIPAWQMIDTFIPNMDERQASLLLNEAKSLAFFELKQTMHAKAEQFAKRGWSQIQRDKSKVDKPSYFDQLPNFGRWGRSSYAGLSYFKLRGWDRP